MGKPDIAIIITETMDTETLKGTQYQIEKWKCQLCGKDKSTLYIDGEWCHGDSQGAHFHKGNYVQGCSGCIARHRFSP